MRPWLSILFIRILFVSLFLIKPVTAAEPKSKQKEIPKIQNGFLYQNSLFYRHNPLGFGEAFAFGYRKKLGDKPKDNVLFGNAHVYTGAEIFTVGIVSFAEAVVLVEPIALLQVKASLGRFLSSSNGDPSNLYDISAVNNSTKGMAAIAGAGLSPCNVLKLQSELRLPVGPLLLRNTTVYRSYMGMTPFADTTHFFDFNYDVIVKYNGALVSNDLDALYLKPKKPLVLGARHTYTHSFDIDSFLENGDNQRLGPLFGWQFKNKPNKNHFRDHYILLLAQWYLQHPLRAAESTYEGDFDLGNDPMLYTKAQSHPYIGFIWGFGGQFAKRNK